jgi:hypothetical protein
VDIFKIVPLFKICDGYAMMLFAGISVVRTATYSTLAKLGCMWHQQRNLLGLVDRSQTKIKVTDNFYDSRISDFLSSNLLGNLP